MTDCNKCGNCCDPVILTADMLEHIKELQGRIGPSSHNVQFVTDHWTVIADKGDHFQLSCDMFDHETRLCTAHDDRPLVCSGYPWYGQEPTARELNKGCSYWEDIGGEPGTIPLTIVEVK